MQVNRAQNSANATCYNVAILAGSLAAGGTQHAAARIGSGLFQRGVSVAVVLFEDDVAYRCDCDVHCLNTPICKKPQMKRLWQSLCAARVLAQFCRKHQIKTVLAFGDICAFVHYLSKIVYGNQAVFVYRMGDNPWLNTTSKVMLALVRWLCCRADHAITVSAELAHLIRTRWKIEDVAAIPNCVPAPQSEQIRLSLADEQFLKDGRFTFITVGSLTEQKNHCVLIDAFSMLSKEERAQSKLIIVGAGILQEDLEKQIASKDLSETVYLLGWRNDVPALLANSDCFVLTSLWEGMPNVILEALSVGISVIAADCRTGVREVLAPSLGFSDQVQYPHKGEVGMLLPAGDEERVILMWSGVLARVIFTQGGILPDVDFKCDLSDFTEASVIHHWQKLIYDCKHIPTMNYQR